MINFVGSFLLIQQFMVGYTKKTGYSRRPSILSGANRSLYRSHKQMLYVVSLL